MKAYLFLNAIALLSRESFAQPQATTTASATATASGSSSSSSAGSSSSNSSSSVPIINVNNPVVGTLNATAWSLIYTYPLYIFANFAGNVLRNVSVNELFHQRNLASVDSPGVIKPNVDTTYTRVLLDLSKQDVVLTIPNITDRYFVYPILDIYGNVITEIGVVNKNPPGDYLIRRTDDITGSYGLQNTSSVSGLPKVNSTSLTNSTSNSTKYAGIVNLPTTYGTMLIRLLVLQNVTSDLDIIHRYQDATKLTPIPRTISYAPSPPGNLSSLAPNGTLLNISTPEKLFNFASKVLPYNQHYNYTERLRVAGILGQAGIYDGQYTPQANINLTQAAAIANASITADVSNPANIRNQGNDWQLSIVPYQGIYGNNYAPRAYVAIYGYQAQTLAQTLYPGYKNVGFTSAVSLQPNTSLLVTFSGKPPVQPIGFWSFTVYGADQYLIKNDLNRFEVGDRNFDIKYQGSNDSVYGPNANATKDGPFQILVQPANIKPPSNWTGNWLPAATNFTFIVRWYTPRPALTNGSYIYPKLQNITAIRG